MSEALDQIHATLVMLTEMEWPRHGTEEAMEVLAAIDAVAEVRRQLEIRETTEQMAKIAVDDIAAQALENKRLKAELHDMATVSATANEFFQAERDRWKETAIRRLRDGDMLRLELAQKVRECEELEVKCDAAFRAVTDLGEQLDAAKRRCAELEALLQNMMPPHEHEQICEKLKSEVAAMKCCAQAYSEQRDEARREADALREELARR